MEKSEGKAVDKTEVKKKRLSKLFKLTIFTATFHNHISIQSHQKPLLRCMSSTLADVVLAGLCSGNCWDLEIRCESGQGQSKWGNLYHLVYEFANPEHFPAAWWCYMTCWAQLSPSTECSPFSAFGGEHWHLFPFQAWQRACMLSVETPKTFTVERTPSVEILGLSWIY